jgi:two-component system, NarL family, nitrate/nitrite response regulator NarL
MNPADVGVSRKFELAPGRVSVVIASRQPVVLSGLTSMLRAESDFNVVGSCRDEPECIEAICRLSPVLALLDVSPPCQSGLQVLLAIKSENLRTRVVFLSTSFECPDTAIAMGAFGVIPREAAPQLVVRSLRQVASGQRLPRVTWKPEPRSGHEPGRRGAFDNLLTERERQIMHLVSKGLSNKEVGRDLNLAEGTIKIHLHRIYQKLAIHNRTALAALAGCESQWWCAHSGVPEAHLH